MPGFGMYEISDVGQVRSLGRMVPHSSGTGTKPVAGRILRPSMSRGVPSVTLFGDGRRKYFKVACLVLLAHVGPCPPGMECCHADDVQTNNRLDNLRWDTREANRVDGLRNRTKACGQSHPKSKMTTGTVLMARGMFTSGLYSAAELSRIFPMSHTAMTAILRRAAWKHV